MSSLHWIDPDVLRRSGGQTPAANKAKLATISRGLTRKSGSIPTKYQTVVYQKDEARGFQSTTSRFDDILYQPNDTPGPGAYKGAAKGLIAPAKVESHSKKGTGTFPSQAHRFRRDRPHQVAPNSYHADESMRRLDNQDFSRAPVSRVFNKQVLDPSERREPPSVPAPNTYNPKSDSKPLPAAASFKARSKRETYQLPPAAFPAPGKYSASIDAIRPKERQGHKNLFRSRIPRTTFPPRAQANPGPGAYDSHIDVHIRRPAPVQSHYLCLSAPAMPLPPDPPLPGPTKYSLQEVSSFTQPVASKQRPAASFRSTTDRLTGNILKREDSRIGPGTYQPRVPGAKQSFLLNNASKWTS